MFSSQMIGRNIFIISLSCSLLINSGVLSENATNQVVSTSNNTVSAVQSSSPQPQTFSEGGSISVEKTTHNEREGIHLHKVINITDTNNSSHMKQVVKNGNNESKNLPTPLYVIPEKNDNQHSVPKKGVKVTDVTNSSVSPTPSSNISSSTLPPPKKPTITEVSEEDSIVVLPAETKPAENSPLTIEASITERKEKKRANFVVPIVAVILSVPVVAIVLSFLYKRGTDWWQHRNYRRMDFLVEGMYNN